MSEDKPTIHIEICKSLYVKGKWNCKIGDIRGSIDSYNATKEEVLSDIKDHMEGKYE